MNNENKDNIEKKDTEVKEDKEKSKKLSKKEKKKLKKMKNNSNKNENNVENKNNLNNNAENNSSNNTGENNTTISTSTTTTNLSTPLKTKEPNTKKKLTQEEVEKFKIENEKISELFIQYYKEQLEMNSKEYDEFLNQSKKDLPITFRISRINPYCDFLDQEINSILIENKEKYKNRVKRYKFNFLDNIYEIDTLSKNDDTDSKLKSILIRENELGILRQELVAMIPVNLVDIKDDDIILDLCASPGNKTIQALEIMQEKARNQGILARGVIIANEIEPDRCSNMGHFFKKQFPINIVTLNNAGEKLPLIKEAKYKPNIVICDVPCSGDGTLRKNKGLRKRWKLEIGYQNYPTQVKLLEMAVKQCRENGYVIYSTCAINPIENESVVLTVLENFKDQIELVNVSHKLNEMGIKHSEGLIRWKVCCKWDEPDKMEWAYDFKTVEKQYKDKITLIRPNMFNEIYTKNNFDSNIFYNDPYNLRNCVRIYSHQNNTGSFFIAIIHKIKHVKDKNEKYSVPLNENKMKTIGEDLDDFLEFLGLERELDEKDKRINDPTKDAFFDTQIPQDNIGKTENENIGKANNNNNIEKNNDKKSQNNETIFKKYANVKKFESAYKNLNKIFKFKNDTISKYLYCRRESSHKIMLFSEKLVEMIDLLSDMHINIIKSGLVVFKKERQNFNTDYRLSHYGAILLEPHISGQILELNRPDLLKLMFEDKDANIQFKNIPKEEKDQIDKFENGSIILIYEAFVLICRKGKGLLALYLPGLLYPSIKKYFLESINENANIKNVD